jgi:hypothetical protein
LAQTLNHLQALEKEAADIKSKLVLNKNKIAKIDHSFHDDETDRLLQLTNKLSKLSADARLAIRQLVRDTFKTITLNAVDGNSGRFNLHVQMKR